MAVQYRYEAKGTRCFFGAVTIMVADALTLVSAWGEGCIFDNHNDGICVWNQEKESDEAREDRFIGLNLINNRIAAYAASKGERQCKN